MRLPDTDTYLVSTPAYLFPELPSPFSSRIQVDFGVVSDVGKVRANNEDSYLISRSGRFWERLHTNLRDQLPARYEENGYLMAVADGMGGAKAGEVASSLALRTGVALMLNAAHWALKLDAPVDRPHEIREAIDRAADYFREMDRVVGERAKSDPDLSGMGTTLTAAYSVAADLFIMHVGDSRAYLFRDGQLRQLTRDHTVAQELVEAGAIRAEEAAHHRLSHILTRAIGGKGNVQAEIRHLTLADGDCVLLCSDGLTGMVSDAHIASVLARGEPAEAACRELVDLALEAGGKDNVTVVLAHYRFPSAGA